MSFVVIVCHEMALGLGLGKWIVDEGPRSDLISANRYILTSGWESLRSQILLGRGVCKMGKISLICLECKLMTPQ